jgi:Peptidase_C39 like family
MRVLPLLFLASCAAPETAVLVDLAPTFGETLHGFALGPPALGLDGDRMVGARYDPRLLLGPGLGRFTSGWMRSSADFDELLVSWNAEVPAGTGLTVEVQVEDPTGVRSPWLYLGDWGLGLSLGERRVEFDGGRVEVDVLRLTSLHRRARLRLTALGSGVKAVAVHRTTLCFTDRARLATLEPGRPRGPVQLEVPARIQAAEAPAIAGRICSPTSVAMVLEAQGVERGTADLAALIYDGPHDLYGNWPRAVQAAFTLGVPGCLVRISNWRTVEHFLAAGVPLIVSVKSGPGELRGAPYPSTAGHLLVIRGLDGAGGVLVNDPAAESLETVARTYRREDLERCWMQAGGVAYALGQ